MKILSKRIFEGRNIYSHKKVIRINVDLEGFENIPSNKIEGFNKNLLSVLPELKEHRCGIDEEQGFLIRLKEGTYLAHICEHMIIALQNRLGINIAYGKAREIDGALYYIIFEYEYKKTGMKVANIAVSIINDLITGIEVNIDEKLESAKNILEKEMLGPSTRAIYNSAKNEGLPILEIGDGIYQIGYGKCGRVFSATIGSNTKAVAVDLCSDKYMTKKVLEMNSIPVIEGDIVSSNTEVLEKAKEIGYPVVLKPRFGSKGSSVFVNINSEIELLKSYEIIREKTDDIIIEKFIKGNDYRVCVVNYKVVAVAHRTPPYIIGDGSKNIKELITDLNKDILRGKGHEKPLTRIKLDRELDIYLSKNKHNLNEILKSGVKVQLRENANLSTGGFAQDVTNIICDENIKLCERIAKALEIDICGIDICMSDISKPLNKNDGIIEVNAAPGIRMHENPISGIARNVSKEILKSMYPYGFKNIPVISVTGTNGKTTTTRLISYVISLMGYNVGMTSTCGISIGGETIHVGDDTGAQSAKTVLINKNVDFAILETARGGLVKRGLGYDLADVGVVTNISEDHIGCDEIKDKNDLAFVKSLVIESIKKDGYAVINADDEYCNFMIQRARKYKIKTILFSMDKNNKYIKENISLNNPTVYIKDEFIVVSNRGKEYKICDYRYMPLTIGGKLKHNIYNALAACSALVGVRIDYAIISKGFLEFKSDKVHNKGRFNVYNIREREIIVDYGHNIDGYRSVIESLKMLDKANVTAIVGSPGDRNNKSIKELGNLVGENFGKIFIKEDINKRGRDEGEVAKIILEGVYEKKGISNDIKIILDETLALKEAFDTSMPGDTIIIFYENYERVIAVIDKLKN